MPPAVQDNGGAQGTIFGCGMADLPRERTKSHPSPLQAAGSSPKFASLPSTAAGEHGGRAA